MGGLKALDDFLINRKTTDFDLYVGLSAGAILAAPLAAGVPPSETLRALDGSSSVVSQFLPRHFYNPNTEELLRKPVEFVSDLALFAPRTLQKLVSRSPHLVDRLRPALRVLQKSPSISALQDVATPIVREILANRIPMPQDYMPSGLFDNSTIEQYLRENFAKNGFPNDFPSFQERVGKDERPYMVHKFRSMKTDAINHEPANQLMYTGTMQNGKPSLGSWLAYGLGSANQDLPALAALSTLIDGLLGEARSAGIELPIVSGGSILSGGTVKGSILGRGVRVHTGAQVEDSILFDNVDIGRHAKIRRAILDKNVRIPEGTTIGYDLEEDKKRYYVTESGIVVVEGHRSHVELATMSV